MKQVDARTLDFAATDLARTVFIKPAYQDSLAFRLSQPPRRPTQIRVNAS